MLKHNDKYYGIILDSDNVLWKAGDTKITLSHIEGSAYDAEYYDLNHQKLNAMAEIKNNRILEFSAPVKGNVMSISLVKIFPSSEEKTVAGASSNGQCKATGSGVLISDNIIITNYHVVEDAEKIEAIININGIPETFSAHVLCTDKTNDLAIVCIKDNKFNNIGNAPFRILPNTVDVGTSVFAMGFPLTSFLGDEVKITDGIISSKSGYEGDIVNYQISVPIQPGNSGGPLFDKNGNLVGITSAGIDKSIADNVGYAIKSPYVLNIIDSAPINISLPKGSSTKGAELPDLIKSLTAYVVYIKIY
jgi:S1-C subfamily serine protease